MSNILDKREVYMKKGFTLAEVLITLGIIGVVAAMTLPTLMQNYQKKVAVERAKKAYAEISLALRHAQADHGDPKNWDYSFSNDNGENTQLIAEKYILPYLKGVEFCGNGYEALDNGCVAAGSASRSYRLANGTNFSIAAYGGQNVGGAVVSVGIKKGAKTIGVDKFAFVYNYKTGLLKPYGYQENLKREDIINGYTADIYDDGRQVINIACNESASVEYPLHACTMLLFYDNWQIKDDYPWGK